MKKKLLACVMVFLFIVPELGMLIPRVRATGSLSNGYVIPTTGDASMTFTYKVSYYDPSGIAPDTYQVVIDGSSVWPMTIESGTLSNGIYRCWRTLSVGSHTFYFRFTSGGSTIYLGYLNPFSGPTVTPSTNSPPTVSNGYVIPTSGDTSTIFYYYATYYDPEGVAPQGSVQLFDDTNWLAMQLYSGSASNGVYRCGEYRTPGSHSFFFLFSDGVNNVHLPTTGTLPGPNVATPTATITVNPNGGRIYVDGSPITSQTNYVWTMSSTHTLDPDSGYQPGTGTTMIFTQWNDGSTADPRTIIASGSTTYTAYWTSSNLGSLRVYVYNIGGSQSISGAKVTLLGIGDMTTGPSGYADFAGLAYGSYNVEVRYQPGVGLNFEEYWGGATATVSGNEALVFTRHSQWVYNIQVNGANPGSWPVAVTSGTSVPIQVTVKNEESVGKNVYVRLILDRDKAVSYDFDQTSGTSYIGNGATNTFSFSFTPSQTGTYYLYAVVYGEYPSGFIPTDQYIWTCAFSVPPTVTSISVFANPTSVVEDGLHSTTITATVSDQNGNPMSGIQVSFATTDGSLSLSLATTSSQGQASVTLTPIACTASPVTVTVTVSAGGKSGQTTVIFTPPVLSAISVSANIVGQPTFGEHVSLSVTVSNTGAAALEAGTYTFTVTFFDYFGKGGIDSFWVWYGGQSNPSYCVQIGDDFNNHRQQLMDLDTVKEAVPALEPGKAYTFPVSLDFPIPEHYDDLLPVTPSLILADTLCLSATSPSGVQADTWMDVNIVPGFWTYEGAITTIGAKIVGGAWGKTVDKAITVGKPIVTTLIHDADNELSSATMAANQGDVAGMAEHLAKMGIYLTGCTSLLSPADQINLLIV